MTLLDWSITESRTASTAPHCSPILPSCTGQFTMKAQTRCRLTSASSSCAISLVMEFLLPPVAPPRRPSWSDIGLNAIDSQMCSGWTETAMPILFVVMSSDITDPTALRQSNKLATFDGATRAVDSFDAIMVCSTTLEGWSTRDRCGCVDESGSCFCRGFRSFFFLSSSLAISTGVRAVHGGVAPPSPFILLVFFCRSVFGGPMILRRIIRSRSGQRIFFDRWGISEDGTTDLSIIYVLYVLRYNNNK